MLAVICAALIGVIHVHHAPSHDSSAPFEDVLAGARAAGLDFVVLTDHADLGDAPLDADDRVPGAERAGLYTQGGRPVLVLAGVEIGTDDGHLLALDVSRMPRPKDSSGRAAIEAIHALGGLAVVPHPFSYGGWRDWQAPFDGIEVHNNAESLVGLGPRLPFTLLRALVDPRGALRTMLSRPDRNLRRWEELLAERPVLGFSGVDAHQNVSLLGWKLDPYERMFGTVRTLCPDTELSERSLWTALRSGRCFIRYEIHASEEAQRSSYTVRFPSGRSERWLSGGQRVLEIHPPSPPIAPGARP